MNFCYQNGEMALEVADLGFYDGLKISIFHPSIPDGRIAMHLPPDKGYECGEFIVQSFCRFAKILTDTNNEPFGAVLKRLRRKKRIRMYKLGMRLGEKSKNAATMQMHRLEDGTLTPTPQQAIILAIELGQEPKEFVKLARQEKIRHAVEKINAEYNEFMLLDA